MATNKRPRKAYKRIGFEDRKKIEALNAQGKTVDEILRCLERAGIRTPHHGKSRSTSPRLCDEQSGGRERWRTAGRNGRGALRLFGT